MTEPPKDEAVANSKPENIGPDGETIVDMSYYVLLGVRGDADDATLKKACTSTVPFAFVSRAYRLG
jgi:hypothetical protein